MSLAPVTLVGWKPKLCLLVGLQQDIHAMSKRPRNPKLWYTSPGSPEAVSVITGYAGFKLLDRLGELDRLPVTNITFIYSAV